MRRLILMRHAKSDWSEPELRDHDRPLNRRGRRAATAIGAWLKQAGYQPGHALVSSTRRTQETWSRMVKVMGAAPTTYVPELYAATDDAMLAVLRGAPDVDCVLMLGHQPGISDFARQLLAEGPADPEFEKYPTGATTIIDFDLAAWSDVVRGSGRIVEFLVPRSLE